ncbi:MAG: MoaD/ThiS family protein [Pseudomonadota bacterium]
MAVIHYFGRFSDLAASGDMPLPAGVTDTATLIDWLSSENARFAEEMARPGAAVVVNQEIVRGVQTLTDRDEIAFMSALSGG